MGTRFLRSVTRRLAAGAVFACLACESPSPSAPVASSPTPRPPTPSPALLADLSGSATSRETGRVINCREDVTAQVSLANRGVSAVVVTGVRRVTRVVSGGCIGGADFTYARLPQLAGGGRTTLIMDEPLYFGGSSCCTAGSAFCDGRSTCSIEQSFTALTNAGSVAAGSFVYQVNFQNCSVCAQVSAAGRGPALPASR